MLGRRGQCLIQVNFLARAAAQNTNMFNKTLLEIDMLFKSTAFALAFAALAPVATYAEETPWLVRVRAVNIDTANKSEAIPALGVQEDAIHVSNKLVPEVDISYFFTPNWAAELVLTYPQKHNVSLNGNKIGTFKHLPPVLSMQYHFQPQEAFKPYVGAGINYTIISEDKINVPGVGPLTLDNDSVGLALGAGFDYDLGNGWLLNVDVKKVQIRSDVYSGGTKVSRVEVDPWLLGVGFGWRF